MRTMTSRLRDLAGLAVIAAGLLPVTAAQAQWCASSDVQPAPLCPYFVQWDRPDAVEVAPNIYAIPYGLRAYPYVHCLDGCGRRARIAHLRTRGHVKHTVINTSKVVLDPPLVIEPWQATEDGNTGEREGRDDSKPRVIHADAEVTIIEPDRMIIRLVRKHPVPPSEAPAEP
jgi:hypothetical protein